MTPTTEKIKLRSYTKRMLASLKTEENWTFDSVIQSLISEHEELNDPDIIADKEKEIKEKYVDISEYHRVYTENTDRYHKIKDLEDEIEETTKTINDFKDKGKQSVIKLKEQQDRCSKLQKTLDSKDWKIETSTDYNNRLTHKIDRLNTELSDMTASLSDIQKDYDGSNIRHENLITQIYKECIITKTQLDTLYHVSIFLSGSLNKRRTFTFKQLYDKLQIGQDDLKEIIPLLNYKIFPVRKHLIHNEERDLNTEYFSFDRHYLKR